MPYSNNPILRAEIATARNCFKHPLLLSQPSPVTMTQSTQTASLPINTKVKTTKIKRTEP